MAETEARAGVIYRVAEGGARVRLSDGTVHDFPVGHLIQFRYPATVVSGTLVGTLEVNPSEYETQDLKPRRKVRA